MTNQPCMISCKLANIQNYIFIEYKKEPLRRDQPLNKDQPPPPPPMWSLFGGSTVLYTIVY